MRTYLKDLRNQKGYSQAKVAELLGITPHYYTYIELGQRRKDMPYSLMVELANVFEVDVTYIINKERELKLMNITR